MKMILVDAVDTALFERIKTRGPIGQLRPIGLIYDQKRYSKEEGDKKWKTLFHLSFLFRSKINMDPRPAAISITSKLPYKNLSST